MPFRPYNKKENKKNLSLHLIIDFIHDFSRNLYHLLFEMKTNKLRANAKNERIQYTT